MSSSTRVLSPIVIVALIVGAVAGLGVGYAITQPTIQQLNVTVDRLEEDVNRLEGNVTASRSTIEQLRVEKTGLGNQLASTESSLSNVQQQLSTKEAELSKALDGLRSNQTEVANLQQRLELIQRSISRLDNDRILLADLRRDVPTTRDEAKSFWEGVKSRAVKVDSTLGVSVEDILSKLDNWFTWLARINNATTFEEFGRLYVDAVNAGAFQYGDAITKFQQDALLTVIVHLDQVVTLLT